MYTNCLQPIRIGSITVRNRFWLAPMDVRLHTHDGYVTDRVVAHYRRMAQGGVGLINLELHIVRSDGAPPYFQCPKISDDSYVPGMKRISDAIHDEGAACFVEIGHFGKFSSIEMPLVVSASVPSLMPAGTTEYGYSGNQGLHEATTEEVDEVLEDFARCALRVKNAGFDGVLLHGAHGFLPQQFMSPHSNRRTDKWGQDRLLFASELVKRVRTACGSSFVIGYRLSGDEYYQKVYPDVKGYTIDDLPKIVSRLVESGVDCIEISAGALDVPRYYAGPDNRYFPDNGYGGYLPLAAAAKSASSVPIIVTGRMNDPDLIERAIGEGHCDLVGMGKQLLADPDFPKKIAEGRVEDIRRCINCGYCAIGGGGFSAIDNHPIQCAINCEIGWVNEGYHSVRPASKTKKVMVAGGGAAGMEAALVLKQRGHDVTLYEKSERLGGQLWSAGQAPGKADILHLTNYYLTQFKKLDVDVRLNTEVTRDLVAERRPDVLVVAAGSTPFRPYLPGIDGPNVAMAADILNGRVQAGQRVVVIGGEGIACEVSDHITEKRPDRHVTLTTLMPRFCTRGHLSDLIAFMSLNEKGASFIPGVRQFLEITPEAVVLIDSTGAKQTLPADTVILAAGARCNDQLARDVKGKGLVRETIHVIGDAHEVHEIFDAVRTGNIVAQHI